MKQKLNFFVSILLMLVIFVGLIKYIFMIAGWKFYLEFLVLLGMMCFAIIALLLIYNGINFGYILSAIISAIALLNFILLYFRKSMSTLLFLSILACITLFVVGVVNIGEKKKKYYKKKEAAEEKKSVLKTYTLGKVVASKAASFYHVPRCDWAKKIKKSNQVWYESDEEAKKAGLKPHNCAK